MTLKILLPTHVLIDRPVTKIVAEAGNGSFCLLPRHVDFLSALVPGLLSFVPDADDGVAEEGKEQFVAVDEGILVKRGEEVLVSTRQAVAGRDLGSLRRTVMREFRVLGEQERTARSAVARLESSFIRRLLDLEEPMT
jgi:F-type H+-transporting ATPase subunit epsilon